MAEHPCTLALVQPWPAAVLRFVRRSLSAHASAQRKAITPQTHCAAANAA